MAESELWNAYELTHSVADRNALVEFYLPLIHHRAEALIRTMPGFMQGDVQDLVNDAIPSLIDLISAFDRSRGNQFATFASQRIRGAMIDAIRGRDWVPRLERQLVRADPTHPITQVFSIARERRETGWNDSDRVVKFDEPAAQPDPTPLDDDSFWATVCKGFEKRERLMLLLHFREGMTMSAVGESLGVSESRVSQMLSAIIRRLRDRFDKDDLQVA